MAHMGMKGSLGKNLVIVLALVAAGFFAAYLRFRPYLGNEGLFTDGAQTYGTGAGDHLRYAVWDRPEPLSALVNTKSAEGRPALSPDGRFLVFSVGRLGLNADLYVAEILDGEPLSPRPLARVDSEADEWSPAFSSDALWFASNRPGGAGGLDLYRASYDAGSFGLPEPVGGGVNTASDECDPAPVPGSATFAFSSNRPRGERIDFDVYFALPGVPAGEGSGDFRLSPLAALNTPFDEREPAFTSDGRALVFASDRDGSLGGFDLYRSILDRGEWLAPEPISGVNTKASERGPLPSQDGFTLLFAVEDPSERSDLFRARSLELFRIPGRPVGWIDLTILASLLLLALLAYLAKTWQRLDVVYKCFLVSVILHLLLLWWFRRVPVESRGLEAPKRESLFKIRLAPRDGQPSAGSRERGGRLEGVLEPTTDAGGPERAQPAVVEGPPASEPALDLPRLETGSQPVALGSASSVAERDSEAASPSVRLEDAGTGGPLLSGEAPALAVGARMEPVARGVRSDSSPTRGRASGAAGFVSRPGVASLTRDAAEPGEPGPAFTTRAEPTREAVGLSSAVRVAHPQESLASGEGGSEAPELRLAARATPLPTGARGEGSPERIGTPAGSSDRSSSSSAAPGPLVALRDSIGRGAESTEEARAPGGVAHELSPERRASGRGASAVALEDRVQAEPPRAESIQAGGGAEPSLSPSLPTLRPPAERASGAGPERASTATKGDRRGSPSTAGAAPEPSPLAVGKEEAGPVSGGSLARRASEGGAAVPAPQLRRLSNVPLEDRALSNEPTASGGEGSGAGSKASPGTTSAPGESDQRFLENLAGMRTDAARPSKAVDNEPTRFRADTVGPAVQDVGPAFRGLAATSPAATERGIERRQWDETPYRARFGLEKEKALKLHGGGAETEKAVAAGLAYLAKRQKSRGCWGSEGDEIEKYLQVMVGKTGLCLLAFLGAGHTPSSATEYSDVTARAVDYLLSIQEEESGHFGHSEAYSHGVATYALAECYALTHDPKLKEPLNRALAQILRNQNKGKDRRLYGGWSYFYPDGRIFDRYPRVSITAWQVMALESARLGGLRVPDRAFDDAKQFLRGSYDERYGYFRYSHDPSRLRSDYRTLPGSTPAAIFALSLLGEDVKSEDFDAAREFVLERTPRAYRFTSDVDFVTHATGNLYFWYYGSLALFRDGGEEWDRWNAGLKATLLPAQEENGSWQPIELYAEFAGDSDRERSYTTALCVLTLEVYYRYFTPLLKVR